jgi:hypothetical protein
VAADRVEPEGHSYRSGARVTLSGTVSYERSGFVLVRWDDGTVSLVWAAYLRREP